MMFAVLGYQVSNEELAAALATVRRHLRPGGLFVADFWYGPAVLRQGPSDRIHEHQVDGARVLRLAHARLTAEEHKVAVRYRVLRLQDQQGAAETEEEHAMRFFFPQELRYFAGMAGLQTVHLGQFLAPEQPLTDDTWNAVGVWRVDGLAG
jgi:SAM-dependent methyltransferase